jgi:hypothetical protein
MQVQADGGLHEETEPRLEPIGTLQIPSTLVVKGFYVTAFFSKYS